MNITTISTYTAEDEAKIEEAFTMPDGSLDIESLDLAIANNDSSIAPIEDLLSFRFDRTGEAPDMMLTSPEAVPHLWENETVVNTLQEWRREGADYSAQMATDLKNFLSAGGVDVSTIADADAFILENMANASTPGLDLTQYDDVTNLVTDMVTIMMKFGNPGMALLAYVLGFDAAVNEEDVSDDTSYSIQDTGEAVATEETDETLPGEYVAVNGEVVAEEGVEEGVETDGVMGTADEVEGPTVGYVENSGLGDVVKDLQGTAIDIIGEAQTAWQDVIIDIGAIDTDDPQEAAELNAENNKKMEDIKKIITSMEEFIKMAQEILDSVIETAGSLNEKQSRVWMDIMR